MSIIYEWAIEYLDGDDIVDCVHQDAFQQVAELGKRSDQPFSLVLIRDDWHPTEGLQDRSWAYLKDGKLPENFTYVLEAPSNHRVPQRFHKEVGV